MFVIDYVRPGKLRIRPVSRPPVQPQCTLLSTGQTLTPQVFYHCRTCWLIRDFICCEVCAQTCHWSRLFECIRLATSCCDCSAQCPDAHACSHATVSIPSHPIPTLTDYPVMQLWISSWIFPALLHCAIRIWFLNRGVQNATILKWILLFIRAGRTSKLLWLNFLSHFLRQMKTLIILKVELTKDRGYAPDISRKQCVQGSKGGEELVSDGAKQKSEWIFPSSWLP
jgi:hypothetical protein